MTPLVAALLCVGFQVGPADGAIEVTEDPALALGRQATARFDAGELEALWADFSAAMQAAFGGDAAGLAAFRTQVDEQLGPEESIEQELVTHQGGLAIYQRQARFGSAPGLFVVSFAFADDGTIESFSISPKRTEAPSEYLDYETKTPLALPFESSWHIVWGGRTLDVNYHTFTRDQRFAYDILIYGEDGKSFLHEGKLNSDYHCFGLPVLAPGPGVVVAAGDGVPDNVPGEMNPRQALGNHVIIDHGNGEYSFLAHFQQGSLQVEPGQQVTTGQLLGRCGNSGNTTEPHIHYHLQTTPEFGDGDGLPAWFLDILVDGEPVARAEPVKDQAVSNP